jgi:peptidyl-prolyl cis-trans isomerase SurA
LSCRLIRYRALILLLAAFCAHAEIIDRVAVSVANRVVTASEIDREIRVVAFQQRKPLDFSPANRRATADRLVEQRLISSELENSRYPTPTDAEVEPEIAQFRKTFSSDAEYQAALSQYGITEDEFKGELLRQRALLLFIEVRFRPGVQVSDQEIEDYFHKVVEPAARSAGNGTVPSLAEFHDKIEETLIGQRVDQQVDTWLAQSRKRVEIVYHEEAFQ